jgi:hypothetical protein
MALTLLIVLSAGRIAAQQESITNPGEGRFGIVEGMWYPDLTCSLGVGWERLIFSWADHQPNGPDDWQGFLNIPDEWLRSAAACNREIVALVKHVPAWATDGTPGIGVPRGLYLPVDDPDNLWAGFMRRMGAYYASRGVQRFIILNEPDILPGVYGYEFEGTVEDYAQMVRVAYLAVTEGNLAASIHLAGTTYWHDLNSGQRLYTDRLLEALRADPDGEQHGYYFDALSLHIYFRSDTVYDIVRVYRDLFEQYGFGDKAIWITETNASPNLDPGWPVVRPQFQITLDQQAAYVIHAAALGLAADADRIAVYKLYDQNLPQGGESFGLLNPADSTPRPAFYAWQTVNTVFSGVESAALARSETINLVRLDHADARSTFAAWARTERAVTITIAATDDKAYLIDMFGAAQIIRPVDGVYRLDLPSAECEDAEGEGCVVGGAALLLVQPAGDAPAHEIIDGQPSPLTFGDGES